MVDVLSCLLMAKVLKCISKMDMLTEKFDILTQMVDYNLLVFIVKAYLMDLFGFFLGSLKKREQFWLVHLP